MTQMIEFQDFSFTYKAQREPTLNQINLHIQAGEKVLILGPSGSGKSTLGHCLNGLIPVVHAGKTTGSFRLQGRDALGDSLYERSLLVSTVLQDTDGQFVGLSVAEDIAFALENDQVQQEQMKEAVAQWSQRLQLENLLQHRPQDLSGGQKQRVSLAGVLIDESPILLFDEPLANLDPKTGQDAIDLIDRLHHEQGATTIIIEHRLEDVLYRSVDRVVLMKEGRIVFNGQPEDLLRSTLLSEQGIREPLYIATLRALGVDVANLSGLASVKTVDVSTVQMPNLPAVNAPVQSRPALLELKEVSVSYGSRQVLSHLSSAIYKGERLAIVGKNGAGKSTLAKALCGFVPIEGELLWNGESILADSVKERSERIGYVLQNPNHMISQTMVWDEVALGLRLRQVEESDIVERVEAVLKTCGLFAFREWPISALSFGQKKRVTIASILVLNPSVLLLDEPTAGQDYRHYREMMEFLDELNRKGHTIVMITHDMQLMLDYADRALVVVDGRICAEGTPAEVLTDSSLLERAHLKETSIFTLAQRLGVDSLQLTQFYMKEGEQTWQPVG